MTTRANSTRSTFLATLVAVCLTLNLCGATSARAQEPIDEVNPMIGTTGPSVYDYGGMIPGVTTPFGMTHWTAQTRENKISVYSYNHKDTTIRGFIGTHQPAIWMGDYGQVSLMPYSGELNTTSPKPRTSRAAITGTTTSRAITTHISTTTSGRRGRLKSWCERR